MTLDEGIKHCEEVADQCEYEASRYDTSDPYENYVASQEGECAERHRQLAEWLRELKWLKEQEPYGDTISRQAVLDVIEREEFKGDAISEIEKLSSVTPHYTNADIQKIQEMEQAEIQKAYELGKAEQSKIGHWIIIDDCEQFIAKCSNCGRVEDTRMISKYPYCHCGAKMQEVEE